MPQLNGEGGEPSAPATPGLIPLSYTTGWDAAGQTQRSKHGDAGHKLISDTAVVEEAEHVIALRSDGISN